MRRFLGIPFVGEWLRARGHGIKSQVGAISGVYSLMSAGQEVQAKLKSGELDQVRTASHGLRACHVGRPLVQPWSTSTLPVIVHNNATRLSIHLMPIRTLPSM